MAFLRNLLAAILGTIIALGILFFLFMIFISLAGASDKVVVQQDSVLRLEIPANLSEYAGFAQEDPFAALFDTPMGLDEILKAIHLAKEDEKIRGISISNTFLFSGISQTKAIRDALLDFKSEGKFIYAYSDYYSQKDYYLSSVADSLYLNPVGEMDLRGLSAEVLYLKEIQEKSGIKMEVVRHGKYKSAVEPFLADEMSEENRTQLSELLQSLWGSLRDEMAAGRGMNPVRLDELTDELGGRTAELAVTNGLIDGLKYKDQYEASLAKAVGVATEDLKFIGLLDYLQTVRNKKVYSGKDKIAVIYAQGEIFYGDGGPDVIGQTLINNALKKAREDDRVKAVVLRVNSPGGSALTSELIWREMELTRAEKPLVVSLSDVAASGGYYIAVGSDKIFAEPTTITGSIGVFGTIPNLYELAEEIGINSEQVGTHQNAISYTPFEPMSEAFRAQLEAGIEATYTTFLERVAKGRNMRVEQVDSLAQGRVWSGTEALELGLVDELGGMDDAISAAAKLASLEDFSLLELPKYKSGFQRFMEDVQGSAKLDTEQLIAAELGEEWARMFTQLKGVINQEGIQARLPFILSIR